MTVSPRAELLAIQRRLWHANKKIIEHSILVKEPGFAEYERAYANAVRDYERVASLDEMMRAVLDSDIVYVGDYHTCNQSQRSFLRMLKAIVKKDEHFILGLELLHARHQDILDSYLSGKISEKTFLNRIKLKEHWVFDLWENFKPLFDFCKYHKIPIFAIDAAPVGSYVRTRDKASAKVIAHLVKKYPNKHFLVFIGDLHIAPKHLPSDVDAQLKRLKIDKKSLILFENSEPIYWKLAKDGIDNFVEVVRLKSGNFCRMHTPPVICQQSYINWLEHEEGEIDYADAKTSFLEIVDQLAGFLKVGLKGARDEVEVFTCGDLEFLKRLEESAKFTIREIRTIKKQILASESYYIAKARIVYLANLSVNHAAEEAAHFIKSVCSGVEKPREIIDAFYANVLHEAIGFFGSKLINHKRKCFHEQEFAELVNYFSSRRVPHSRRLEYDTARLVVEYRKLEKKGRCLIRPAVFHERMELFMSLTHALGYMLGDRLYYGLISRAVGKSQVRDLFVNPWLKENEPFKVYCALQSKLKKVKIPKRM